MLTVFLLFLVNCLICTFGCVYCGVSNQNNVVNKLVITVVTFKTKVDFLQMYFDSKQYYHLQCSKKWICVWYRKYS